MAAVREAVREATREAARALKLATDARTHEEQTKTLLEQLSVSEANEDATLAVAQAAAAAAATALRGQPHATSRKVSRQQPR